MLIKCKHLLLFLILIFILLATPGCMEYPYPAIPTTGSINILTNPSGAKIFFNGDDTGHITPYILTNVPMGSYIITLTLSGYLNSSNVVEVKANQVSTINANLTPAPTLPTTPPTFLTLIEVQPETMNLGAGEFETISSITAYYSDLSTANIPLTNCFYYSNNSSCATVNSSGLITGVSAGSTIIMVVYPEGTVSKTDTIIVTVTTVITPIVLTSIEVLPSFINLDVGESQTFDSVTAYYSDSSSANVNLTACNYSSSNSDYATVSNGGTITAVSDGSTTITISYTEDESTKTDTVEVTIGTVTQNEVVYRALCVGVGDYIQGSDNDLSAPPYDVDKIRQILQQCKFGMSNTTFSNINYLKDWQATKSNILQAITSTFAGADSDDVSYFYFSGHGSRVENTSYICPADITSFADSAISVNELEAALSSIPGTKVVFLDTCYSGGFIGKAIDATTASKEKLESFNDEVVNIFSQTQSKGLLTTNQYKVLTSCHYYQLCWEIQPEDGDPFGVFTMALCEGCGYSGNYPADTNMDTMVSLQEAYLYVRDWVFSYRISQDVQIYPDNSTFTIVEY